MGFRAQSKLAHYLRLVVLQAILRSKLQIGEKVIILGSYPEVLSSSLRSATKRVVNAISTIGLPSEGVVATMPSCDFDFKEMTV